MKDGRRTESGTSRLTNSLEAMRLAGKEEIVRSLSALRWDAFFLRGSVVTPAFSRNGISREKAEEVVCYRGGLPVCWGVTNTDAVLLGADVFPSPSFATT